MAEKNLKKFQKVMHGNEAVAWGAVASRVQVFSVYPITPQTTIPEKLAEFLAKGYLEAKSIHVESEASAAASAMAASRAGARAFTATSSQGLWLMAEQIYSAGIRRLPLVMANVNRTLGPPWNILLSHEDSLALRDIPWIQFYAATAQEALDSIIIAYKVAEQIHLPAMVNLDGFYMSHASEVVEVPEQKLVDQFLPSYKPLHPVDFANPRVFDPSIEDNYTTEFRYLLMRDLEKTKVVASEAQQEFGKLFGRKYQAIEKYKMENAKLALVALGSVSGTIKAAIEKMEGVGLIRIRMFRPFPEEALREALVGVEKVAVIDRDMQSILAQELNNVLAVKIIEPQIISFPAGMGGRDIDTNRVREIIEMAQNGNKTFHEPVWIDLKKNGKNGQISHAEERPRLGVYDSKSRSLLENIPEKEFIAPGEFACQGCAMTIASRYVLKGLGERTIEVRPACCASVVNGRWPNCASLYPLENVCFEEAAAEASGLRAGFDALGIQDVNVLAFAGDGGTYDIGLQALSGAAERNDNIIFVCYDNEAYMNTGIQRSSSTPFGAWSSTTPDSKPQFKKDMMRIMAAHRIPYAATASVAYPEDLLKKVIKAKKIKGSKFILIFSSCPPGWKFSPELSIKVARLAVETRIWPLYEIFDGEKYALNKMPAKKDVADYLKIQGRFSALTKENAEIIQQNIDKNWARLKRLASEK